MTTVTSDPRIQSGASKISDGARELKDAAFDRASEFKDAAWHKAVEARDAAMQTGTKVAQRSADLFHECCDETEAMIKSHPMQSLLIAGGVGFILGAMLLRRVSTAPRMCRRHGVKIIRFPGAGGRVHPLAGSEAWAF